MTVQSFVRIVWTVLKKIEKRLFFGHFWVNFGCLSHHSHGLDAIAQIGLIWCRMKVQIIMKIVRTVLEKFVIFIERSGEKTIRLLK